MRGATEKQISFALAIANALGLDISETTIRAFDFDEARDFISENKPAFDALPKKSRSPHGAKWDPADDPNHPDDEDFYAMDVYGIDPYTGGCADW